MRKILASLFVIAALLAVGVFATGAYFLADPVDSGPVTFTAGNASFDITLEPGSDTSIGTVGPGWSKHACVKITSDGDYALNMTQVIEATGGSGALYGAILLRVQQANASCEATGTFNDWAPLTAYNNYVLPIGTLPDPGTIYVLEDLKWDETGSNQSALQGESFTLHVTINGQTLP